MVVKHGQSGKLRGKLSQRLKYGFLRMCMYRIAWVDKLTDEEKLSRVYLLSANYFSLRIADIILIVVLGQYIFTVTNKYYKFCMLNMYAFTTVYVSNTRLFAMRKLRTTLLVRHRTYLIFTFLLLPFKIKIFKLELKF